MQTWWSSAEQQREIEAVRREYVEIRTELLRRHKLEQRRMSSTSTVVASSRESWSVGRHFLGGDQEVWGFGVLWPCVH